MADVTIYFDGLCEPTNPGGLGCYGYVIWRGDEVFDEGFGDIGQSPQTTNNSAEYAALIKALERLIELDIACDSLTIRGDSNLVVNQVNGKWKINKPHLQLYVNTVRKLLERFPGWELEWVPRDSNADADELSNRAYESKTGLKVVPRRERTWAR